MRPYKRKKLIIFLLILSLILLFSGIPALAVKYAAVEGDLSLGAVSIRLSSGVERETAVLPGEQVSFSPRITNTGYPCYIRASCDFSRSEDYVLPQEFPDLWIKGYDGYWYYTEPLQNGSSVLLFDHLKISPRLPDAYRNQKIPVIITAEAVQAGNFTPDFHGFVPWKGLKAEPFSKVQRYSVSTYTETAGGVSIVYENDAEELVVNARSFLRDIPVLMPGDSFSQTAMLKNNYDQTVGLLLYSDADLTDPLLRKSVLSIRSGDGSLIYEGPLSGEAITGRENAVVISDLPPHEDRNVTFSLSVPEDLDNQYTLWNSTIRFVFFARTEGGPTVVRPVETGDPADLVFYLTLAGAALFTLSFSIYRTMRRPASKKENA